jgi:hypothetical protein
MNILVTGNCIFMTSFVTVLMIATVEYFLTIHLHDFPFPSGYTMLSLRADVKNVEGNRWIIM